MKNRALFLCDSNETMIYESSILEVKGQKIEDIIKSSKTNLSKVLNEKKCDHLKLYIHNNYPVVKLTYSLCFYSNNIKVLTEDFADEKFLRYLISFMTVSYTPLNLEKKCYYQYILWNDRKIKDGDSIVIHMNPNFIDSIFSDGFSQLIRFKNYFIKIKPNIKGFFILDLEIVFIKENGDVVRNKDIYHGGSEEFSKIYINSENIDKIGSAVLNTKCVYYIDKE